MSSGWTQFPSALDSFHEVSDRVSGDLSFAMTDLSDRIFVSGGTASFPSKGIVRVGSETIEYARNDGDSLSKLSRGASGTQPIPHRQGIPVKLAVFAAHHNSLATAVLALQRKVGLVTDPPSKEGSLSARESYLRMRYVTPRAMWRLSRRIGPAPLTVQFSDMSAGFPTRWRWEFGDLGSSDERDPSWTFDRPGSYDVALTVYAADGRSARTRKTAHVEVLDPDVLGDGSLAVEVFSPSRGGWVPGWRGRAPLKIRLVDQTSGRVSRRSFDFGDGTGTVLMGDPEHVVTHEYAIPGTYVPSVVVESSSSIGARSGRIARAAVPIEVLDALLGPLGDVDPVLPECDGRDLQHPPGTRTFAGEDPTGTGC